MAGDRRRGHPGSGHARLRAARRGDARRPGSEIAEAALSAPLLAVEGLTVDLPGANGKARILDHVSLTVGRGEVVGLVGESGSGKSTLALALGGLLPGTASVAVAGVRFGEDRHADLAPETVARWRGTRLAYVFQDPMTALSPVHAIGDQIVDSQRRRHPNASHRTLRERGEAMLARVGIPDPARRMGHHPGAFSGGMRQRIAIAMALLAEPDLLVLDEPTTALDATVEAAIVELFKAIRAGGDAGILVISHSFGLVAELADRVAVLYAGRIVEEGPTDAVLRAAVHPYTAALLACDPDPWRPFDPEARLPSIPGSVPDPTQRTGACVFAARCARRFEACDRAPPRSGVGPLHTVDCWLAVRP